MTKQINQKDPQDRPHGVWEDYHPEGTLMWRRPYLHGALHGLSEWYYKDGTLWWRTHYYHGKEHGIWQYYFTDGTPLYKRYLLRIK
jgi:antitoxin component YwqK of YwqJK toxin-antitoxin module